ncbi:MAG: zf-HC2 domain-containing protein [Bryobacteraceae bacterium]|nr:zf-HC2 domain-containing protein [Bryobacteraceae bacterium]
MNCAELDILVCDYVDGTLDTATRAAAEAHLTGCAACHALVDDSREVLSFLEGVPEVTPPAQLITRIIHEVPASEGVQAPGRKSGWLRNWLKPVWQPRLAMGMAMTILSFSMLGRFTAPVKQLKPSDLDPVKVWAAFEDKTHRVWDRTLKYYESLRVVYEIQSRLKDLSDQEAEQKNEQKKTEGSAK